MESNTLKKSNKPDLTQGNIKSLLFKLAFPTVISQIVNMLYNIVDRIYIGRIPEVGVQALTGLGLCFPIIMVVSAFSALVGSGGAPKAAIEMGKGNHEKAEKILGNCMCSLFIVSILLMIFLRIFSEDLLYMFGASDDTIVYSLAYLDIYTLGTVSVLFALGLNPFITTQGFSNISMKTVLIGAVTNIILDPIFIFGFNMGVQGAGLATIIAQTLSTLWVLRFLFSDKNTLKVRKENLKLDKKIILPVMGLGLAPFVMNATESILNISFNVSLQKYGGDLAVGAMTILGSVMSLCFLPLQGIAQGAQPIISYNYGAGRMDRVIETIKLQICVCLSFTCSIWVLLMMFPEVFIGLFNNDPELLEISVWSMRVYVFGLFIMGLQSSCQHTFIALGYAKISLFLACLRKIILLIPLIFILPNFFENKVFAVFLAEPIADITATIITFTTFVITMKKILAEQTEKV